MLPYETPESSLIKTGVAGINTSVVQLYMLQESALCSRLLTSISSFVRMKHYACTHLPSLVLFNTVGSAVVYCINFARNGFASVFAIN